MIPSPCLKCVAIDLKLETSPNGCEFSSASSAFYLRPELGRELDWPGLGFWVGLATSEEEQGVQEYRDCDMCMVPALMLTVE